MSSKSMVLQFMHRRNLSTVSVKKNLQEKTSVTHKQLTVLRGICFRAWCSWAVTIYKRVCQYVYLFVSLGCSYIWEIHMLLLKHRFYCPLFEQIPDICWVVYAGIRYISHVWRTLKVKRRRIAHVIYDDSQTCNCRCKSGSTEMYGRGINRMLVQCLL